MVQKLSQTTDIKLNEVTILAGCATWEDVFISIISSDIPFDFKMLQFLVNICFSMSIIKSQGHMLKVAGLQLQDQWFSQMLLCNELDTK